MHGVDVSSGALEDWPALRQWSETGLIERAGDMEVTVDVTPNGRGDAVTRLVPSGGEDGQRIVGVQADEVDRSSETSAASLPGPGDEVRG